MADITLTVDGNQAINTLKRIQDQTQKLTDKFSGLKSMLGGLALGSLITNTIRWADSLQDLSDATGVALDKLIAFNRAVIESGGDSEKAGNAVLALTKNLGQAKDGSDEVQKAFREVGIGLRDLRSLSEQDIFERTIVGLAGIDDTGKRASIAMKLLGNGAKGIDFAGLAGKYTAAGGAAQGLAKNVSAAAEMQGKLDRAFGKLQEAILKVMMPLVNFINKLDDKKIETFINAVVQLGAAAAIFVTVANGVRLVVAIVEKLITVAGGLAIVFGGALLTVLGGVIGIFKTFSVTLSILSRYSIPAFISAVTSGTGVMTALAATGLMLARRFGYLLGSVLKIGAGFLGMAKGLGILLLRFAPVIGAIILLNEVLGKLAEGKTFEGMLDDWAASLENFVTEKFPKLAKAINWLGEKMGMAPPPSVTGVGNGRSAGVGGATADEMAKYNENLNKGKKGTQELSDQAIILKAEINKIRESYAQTNLEIKNGIDLQSSMIGMTEDEREKTQAIFDTNKRINDQIDELLQKRQEWSTGTAEQQDNLHLIDNLIKEIKNSYGDVVASTAQGVDKLQSARLIEQDRLRTLENITKQYDSQVQRQQQLGDILRSARDQQTDVAFERSQIGKSPLEQQMASIRENSRKAALEAGRAYSQAFEDTGDGLTPQRAQELANGLDQIALAYKQISDEQIATLETTQTFTAGWQEAFNQYYESATNAATKAKNMFQSIMGAMEGAIDKFVMTGKFSFKDFAKEIIADLIKIQIKAAAISFLKSAGFAGFFAEGGYIPPGKYGMVGEAGPELVSGPANVTPMDKLGGGGGTVNNYITNNINAVDAKSVAALFAQNRKTLLGATETARKEMPGRRR